MRLLTALLAALLVPAAHAQFDFVSQSAVLDLNTQDVTFTIQFNEPPNFLTTDSVGRQADSFQYFIIGDPTLPYPQNYDSIIRGEEIHYTTDLIPIRDAYPPSSDPDAGGWGALITEVPFTLDGDILSFSVPLGDISQHSLDGVFSFMLQTYQYGAQTETITAQDVVTPEPATLALFGTGVLGCCLLLKLRESRA